MIEDFASRLLRDVARLDPCTAVVDAGEQEVDGLTDYSPDGHQARADLAAGALRELETLPPTSPLHGHLAERLRARIAFHDAGEDLRELHAAATGPLQLIRQCVQAAVPARDAEDTAYEDGWARVAARQAAIPATLAGYARSLMLAAAHSTPSRSGTSSCTPTRTPSAGASRESTRSLPRSASDTLTPTPKRPAPGYTSRPRSSTPRTSRLPRLALGDIAADRLVGDVLNAVLVDQPVIDPLRGVPLPATPTSKRR